MQKEEKIDMSVIRHDINNPVLQVSLIVEYKQSRFRIIEMIRQLLNINIPKGPPRIYNGEPFSGHAQFTPYRAYESTIANAIERQEQRAVIEPTS